MILVALMVIACDDDGGGDPAPGFTPGATANFTHGIASGDVRPNSVVLWTRAERGDNVSVELSTSESFDEIATRAGATTSADADYTVKLRVEGLSPDTRYYYRFRAGDNVSDTGTFVTAAPASVSKRLRFAFSGDSDGTRLADGSPRFNEFQVLDRALADDPAFFVYFGDTIYGDREPAATTLDAYRAKYRQNRDYRALRGMMARVPVITMWDDHEVVNDFAGETVDQEMFRAGRRAFLEYMPIADSGDDAVMYRTFRFGADVELIVLDARSFRDAAVDPLCRIEGAADPVPAAAAPGAPEGLRGVRGFVGLPAEAAPGCLEALVDAERTMLGGEQKEYLLERLKSSDATWKVIVTPVPVQALYALPYDRWEGYAAERREILEFIRDNGIANVVFIATDMHANIFGPVRVDPFDAAAPPVAYEAVAGPIATTPLAEDVAAVLGGGASDLIDAFFSGIVGVECAKSNAYAYALVDVDPEANTLTITAKDDAGNELCRKELRSA